jgi:hypothetical protein
MRLMRSTRVALVLMGRRPYVRHAAATHAATIAPPPSPVATGQTCTAIRRGGFGLLGDRLAASELLASPP